MRHIEFFGVPGSGKSTLLEPTIGMLRERGQPACTLSEAYRDAVVMHQGGIIPHNLIAVLPRAEKFHLMKYRWQGREVEDYQLFFTDYPELAALIPRYVSIKSSNYDDRRVYSGWFYKLITRYYAAVNRSDAPWVVIDEGFVNRTITLFCGYESDQKQPGLERYLNAIPHPDLVIVPQVPVELAVTRIRSGEREFPYQVPADDHDRQVAYLRERKNHVKKVIQLLEETGVEIITVDNSGSLRDSLEQLRDKFSVFA